MQVTEKRATCQTKQVYSKKQACYHLSFHYFSSIDGRSLLIKQIYEAFVKFLPYANE